MTGPAHLSFSAIEDYTSCPEKYRLRREMKVPREGGWAGVGGGAFHTVTERLDLIDLGVPVEGPTEFAEVLEEEIADRLRRAPESPPETWRASGRKSKDWPDKENKEWWLANGPGMVNRYRAWLKQVPWVVHVRDGEPAVEIKVTESFGGHPFVGYVDRVMEHMPTGTLAVMDLKTGSREPSVHTQLDFYADALRRLGFDIEFGFYYMARAGEMTVPVRPNDSDRLHYLAGQALHGIREKVFPPSPGMLCTSCDVRNYCWLMNGALAAEVSPFPVKV